jgi:hypothetical protein
MVISIKEGFPHSDICGSTIARISPQLFAACHVLHRLLAPRHPPNALLFLHQPISSARTQDQTAPHATNPKTRPAQTHTLNPSTNQPFHLYLSKEQSTDAKAPVGPVFRKNSRAAQGIERGERSLFDRQLVYKDRSQPKSIRPRRHNTFLERR